WHDRLQDIFHRRSSRIVGGQNAVRPPGRPAPGAHAGDLVFLEQSRVGGADGKRLALGVVQENDGATVDRRLEQLGRFAIDVDRRPRHTDISAKKPAGCNRRAIIRYLLAAIFFLIASLRASSRWL